MTLAKPGERVCVIGAGPAGLASVKALRDCNIPCVCFEREDDVGGNWYFGKPNSSVYCRTHMISSKRLTEFADLPMPASYPPFPRHEKALAYLRAYATEFGLYESIELNSAVERVESAGQTGWKIHIAGETQPRQFDRLIIANGHHWSPKFPTCEGEFSGEFIHAHDFKDPYVFQGKRVLVVGAGNSGCDIAVEAAQHAASASISVRRGYHFLPKFLRGRPIDSAGVHFQRLRLPLWFRRLVAGYYSRLILGPPQQFGLPKPDHKLFETHPIVNSQLLYQLGHGRLQAKPDVVAFDQDEVVFADDTRESFDMIVCATGYEVRFPFIDKELLNWNEDLPQLHLHSIHPNRDDVFVVGMIQPNGGLWPLAELQAKLIARAMQLDHLGLHRTESLRKEAKKISQRVNSGIQFAQSSRHRLEVDYYTFRKDLSQLLAKTMRRTKSDIWKRNGGAREPFVRSNDEVDAISADLALRSDPQR